MYIMFHNVVCISRTDSEIFDDSVELQQFFIKIRDELCKNGEILMSSALNFTLKHLHSDVEQEKREKIPKEIEEDQQKTEEDDMKGWCKLSVFVQCKSIEFTHLVIFNAKKQINPRVSHKSHVRKSPRKSECTSRTVSMTIIRIAWVTLSMWIPRSQNCSHISCR